MESKTCIFCNLELPVDDFYLRSARLNVRTAWCIKCSKSHQDEIRKISSKRYYHAHKEQHNLVVRTYQAKNKEHLNAKRRELYKNNRAAELEKVRRYKQENLDRLKLRNAAYRARTHEQRITAGKTYRQNNRDKIAAYQRDRMRDPVFKLKCRVSTSVYHALVAKGGSKAGASFFSKVDYTLQELKAHIECQFLPEMSWSNYGTYWEVHHIKPTRCFKFNSMDDPEFKECWSLDNLMPLPIIENRRLGLLLKNYINNGGSSEPRPLYRTKVPTGISLLPWALEEVTRQAAQKILTNKTGGCLCL